MSLKNIANKQEPETRHAKGHGSIHVYDELRAEILALTLQPGEPLDETSLAERFGMSRSPIREALIRLAAEGLVVTLSNRSTLVAPINMSEFPRYVEALDFLQRINTRLAAQHRTDDDIARIVAAADAFDAACTRNTYLEMSATNRDFHLEIGRAGKNPYLTQAYGQLLDEGRRILHLHFDYLERSQSDGLLGSEHREMIDAIKARDVTEADRLAHAHTRQFHNRFMMFLTARYSHDFDFGLSTYP